MSNWSAGYVADIGYTFGYYPELNPARIQLAFLNRGIVPPAIKTACELGFGQGLGTNIHASASSIDWYGTDFNPSQAAFAQELAQKGGTGAKLYDEAFADFVNRQDLPDFDFIGVHGIWSWVSDENRKHIVEFVRRKLKVGGVVYISYNTFPGWAAFAPLRHLMTEHAEVIGSAGRGIVNRIDDAIGFAEKLLGTNPAFLRANPLVRDRISKIKEHNRHYLAHEYFNRDWHPMHFSTMAEWLEPAKLQFGCTAHYIDHVDQVNMTAEQQTFLAEIPDPMFRESVKDFLINQQFRRDYWIKGMRTISPLEQLEGIRNLAFVMVSPPGDIPLKINGAQGEATLTSEIYQPFIDLMADHKVRTVRQIEKEIRSGSLTFGQLVQVIIVMAGLGHLGLAQDESVISKARKHTDRLNALLIKKSRGDSDIGHLASPVIGGGFSLGRIQQLFVEGIREGRKQAEELAQFVWDILSPQGQKVLKDGKPLLTPEENLAELLRQAKIFTEQKLPIVKALQIL